MLDDIGGTIRGSAGHHHGVFHRAHPRNPQIDLGLRKIVVAVDGSSESEARLSVAIQLAKLSDAKLTLLGFDPSALVQSAPAVDSEGDDLLQLASDENPPAAIRGDFATFPKRVQEILRDAPSVIADWHAVPRSCQDIAVAQGLLSDLVVLGVHQRNHASLIEVDPADVALGSGRPILLVPPNLLHTTIGQRVLIGWDGSREAARALRDSMPLMRDARRIVIVEIGGPDEWGAPDADAAQDYLERHGFAAHVVSGLPAGPGIYSSLLDHIMQIDADLFVGGLFHHARVKERIFGGVSQEILKRTPIPALLSH
jgi:nucleotide-binding universal stress UspA family protein